MTPSPSVEYGIVAHWSACGEGERGARGTLSNLEVMYLTGASYRIALGAGMEALNRGDPYIGKSALRYFRYDLSGFRLEPASNTRDVSPLLLSMSFQIGKRVAAALRAC